MTTKELKKAGGKYWKFVMSDRMDDIQQSNITNLLEFIGRCLSPDAVYPIGVAYDAIQERTNKFLGVSKKNLFLRTSKREVQSIRQFYKEKAYSKERKLMKIPYKVEGIFISIVQLVEEINKHYPIPNRLQKVLDKTYRMAFYNQQITHCIANEKKINDAELHTPGGLPAQKALLEDFNSGDSVFYKVFLDLYKASPKD